MFKALLNKAAGRSDVFNMSCDVKHLLTVFPHDQVRSSRHLISFAENVSLALEHAVSEDELVVRAGTEIGDKGHPALGHMLCTVIEGIAAAHHKLMALAAQRLSTVDQIFKQQTGADVDVSQRGALSRLLL